MGLSVAGCGVDTTATVVGGTGPQSTSTVLTSSASISAGAPVTLTATVTPANSPGGVNFIDAFNRGGGTIGTVSLQNAPATLSVNAGTVAGAQLAIGTHVLTAQYQPSPGQPFFESTSAELQLQIADPAATCGLGTAVANFTSGTTVQSNQSYGTSTTDQSSVCATGSGTAVTLVNPQIGASGQDTSFLDPAGLDAALLAYGYSATTPGGGSVTIQGGTVAASGIYQPAVVASGMGAAATLINSTVYDNGFGGSTLVDGSNFGQSVGAYRGGTVTLQNTTITTLGNGGALNNLSDLIAADGTGSSISIEDVVLSNKLFDVSGGASLTLNGVSSTGSFIDVYPDVTSPASATVTLDGGTYSYPSGGALSISATSATVNLSGVTFQVTGATPGSPNIFISTNTSAGYPIGPATWNVNAVAQTFAGSIALFPQTTLNLSLKQGTQWSGSIFPASQSAASVSMDTSSSWNVMGNCALVTLSDAGGISGTSIGNIFGNGFTVTYVSSQNPGLGGKTYTLANGGTLQPAN